MLLIQRRFLERIFYQERHGFLCNSSPPYLHTIKNSLENNGDCKVSSRFISLNYMDVIGQNICIVLPTFIYGTRIIILGDNRKIYVGSKPLSIWCWQLFNNQLQQLNNNVNLQTRLKFVSVVIVSNPQEKPWNAIFHSIK